jgi:outer membrane protein OmpA-like peptidoglycan-associated protein
MTRRVRWTAALAALATLVSVPLLWSCGPKRVATAGQPGESLVALLPDPDSGAVGRASASGAGAAVDLDSARQSTAVANGQAPAPTRVMTEAEVQQVFGDALAALPPAPTHFTLFYKFDSDEFTDDSRALVPDILQAVKGRPFPDVFIVGHTDTIGTASGNFALGMRRAVAVRTLLLEAGLDPALVEVASHGESDLLIATADNVAEPRNRRVEITVR